MSQEMGYAALGALIAVALVLAVLVWLGIKAARAAAGYVARFKGLQAGRNAKGEMTFGGVIDESRPTYHDQLEPDEGDDDADEERELQ